MKYVHPLERQGVRALIVEQLGVSQQSITNWKTRGIPVIHCVSIERITKGAVTRQELRPDDWQAIWPELATKKRTAKNNSSAASKKFQGVNLYMPESESLQPR